MVNSFTRYLKRKLFSANPEIYPVSDVFGIDRGTPIDRFFIEKFLEENKSHIKGKVLEIAESTYSKSFGSDIESFEILHSVKDTPNATIIGDLSNPEALPANRVDCFICTQTYNFIYDFRSAVKGSWQLLKPGGVLLATVAGITQISSYDRDRWGDYWRFTTQSAQKTFDDVFGENNVIIDYYGNCYAATNFLRGLSVEEVKKETLLMKVPEYPVIITIIAKKTGNL